MRGVARLSGGLVAATATGLSRIAPGVAPVRIAGTGRRGFNRDAGPALEVKLDDVRQLAAVTADALLLADSGNDRIRIYREGTRGLRAQAGTGPGVLGRAAGDGAVPNSIGKEAGPPPRGFRQAHDYGDCRVHHPPFTDPFGFLPDKDPVRGQGSSVRFETSVAATVELILYRDGKKVMGSRPRRARGQFSIDVSRARGSYDARIWGRMRGADGTEYRRCRRRTIVFSR